MHDLEISPNKTNTYLFVTETQISEISVKCKDRVEPSVLIVQFVHNIDIGAWIIIRKRIFAVQ